jgi:hypothetical protein
MNLSAPTPRTAVFVEVIAEALRGTTLALEEVTDVYEKYLGQFGQLAIYAGEKPG